MLISDNDTIEGARIVRPIGRIKAVTTWRAAGRPAVSETWRERVLRDLVRRAEDVDADAIVRIDFRIEPIACDDEAGIALERVCVEGVAVRLAA